MTANEEVTSWGIQFRAQHRDQWVSGKHGPIKFVTKKDAEGMIEILCGLDQKHPRFTVLLMH
jgi:hypothetical protein